MRVAIKNTCFISYFLDFRMKKVGKNGDWVGGGMGALDIFIHPFPYKIRGGNGCARYEFTRKSPIKSMEEMGAPETPIIYYLYSLFLVKSGNKKC
jgi:hypothetical protein